MPARSSIDERPVALDSPREAQAIGISTIYQEFNLVPQLSAAENIYLGREPMLRAGVIDRGRSCKRARALLRVARHRRRSRKRPSITLAWLSSRWSKSRRRSRIRARILIMDEPTSALTASEIEELFAAIRRFTGDGGSVIYISHRLEELARVGHRATVLRDGRYRRHATAAGADSRARANDGRIGTSPSTIRRRRGRSGAEILRVEGVARGARLRDVELHACTVAKCSAWPGCSAPGGRSSRA